MLYFMKPLPEEKIDTTEWSPFIKNQWFRNNFMYFVYCFQAILYLTSIIFGAWRFSNFLIKVGLFIFTFAVHELLHLLVIYKAGDISITYSGVFFWITSGAILSKFRFFVFMALPFIGLTVLPAAVSVFTSGEAKSFVIYVAWINSIIAGSDIINSVLIAAKPSSSLFYRGYYKTNSKFVGE